jgi:hypothetical protein
MIRDFGPFTIYKVRSSKTLCISLKCIDDWACGWEYGYKCIFRGTDKPILEFRVGKLMVFFLEVWKGGCEVWLMGFWFLPSWGKGRKR